MVVVMVAGDFGKLHTGHLDHIKKAYEMGDHLIIVTHTDESIRSRKSYEPEPLWRRIAELKTFLRGLGGEGKVVLAKDTDGKCIKSLKFYRPDIFAKGGGYTKDTLPPEEVEICKTLGIQIVFDVGDRLWESREIC